MLIRNNNRSFGVRDLKNMFTMVVISVSAYIIFEDRFKSNRELSNLEAGDVDTEWASKTTAQVGRKFQPVCSSGAHSC